MKYLVRVSQTRYGQVEVNAATAEEAKAIASGKEVNYFNEKITDMMAEPIDDKTYMVVECCPCCLNEIEMRWNVSKQGYKAFCPVCGNRLMLCDECQHPNGKFIGGCDYNTGTDSCKYDKREVKAPLGKLIYGRTTDTDYPGVWIDLLRPNGDKVSLVSTEFDPESKKLITRVYGDGKNEDYTVCTEHENV